MKKIGITLAVCAILFTTNGLAQNTNVPYLIKESLRKNAAQLKSGIVGSYPRHTEEFNWVADWILYRTIETSYTSFGEPSAIEYTQGANKSRDLYSYDAQHNQTERKAQNWTGGTWVDSERWTYTYNASGYETETRHEQWNGTLWDLKNGTQSAITMDGNRISVVTMKTWNDDTNTWDNSLRNTYTYTGSGANFATVVMEEWTTQWVFTVKAEYTWSGNQVSESIMYVYENGAWKRSSKYVYEHPDSNTNVMTISMDDEAGGWTETSRITTRVDSHGNATLNQMEMYMGTWTIFSGTRFQLTYSGNDLTQRITEQFSFGSDWANTLKEVFSNFASLSTDITLMPDSGLSVFPNPAGKEAIVRLSLLKAGSVTLSVVSMTGQEILKETISANGSDVNYQLNLKGVRPGSYILIARDKQGVEVGKTRFIKDKE
ncbi:MAG: T9SS type A sorting domain-containing protein [Bacteroidales bacterium]